MHKALAAAAVVTFVFGHSITANAAELTQPMKLCAANTRCSFGPPDATGVRRFKIKLPHMTASIRCNAEGKCWQMFPKRGAVPVANLVSLFAVK